MNYLKHAVLKLEKAAETHGILPHPDYEPIKRAIAKINGTEVDICVCAEAIQYCCKNIKLLLCNPPYPENIRGFDLLKEAVRRDDRETYDYLIDRFQKILEASGYDLL